MMFLFFLAGILFLGDGIYRGFLLYQMISSPVEYAAGNTAGKITDAQIAEIRGLDNVTAVSRQRETTVTLHAKTEELTFACLEISGDYLETAYGVESSRSMRTFYLNQAAWEQVRQKTKRTDGDPIDSSEMHLSYVLNGATEEENEKGTAKFVPIDAGESDEQPYVFCEGNSVSLADSEGTVRVRFGQQDLDGRNLKRLNQLGVEVENAEELQIDELEREMQFLRLKYDVGAAVLCFLIVWCLRR